MKKFFLKERNIWIVKKLMETYIFIKNNLNKNY